MVDNIHIIVLFVAGLAIALEITFYSYWRSKLYSLYLDYYNRKTHPLAPEAWRGGTGFRVDFLLEWKMFFSPVLPEMGDELVRRLKRQKLVVIFYYLPVLILFAWALYQGWPDILRYIQSLNLHT